MRGRLTVGVIVMNQLAQSKPFWANLTGITRAMDHELIVVDNGSVDGSADWIEKYILPRWGDGKVIRNPVNRGVFAAMNQIWRSANTNVITVVHNDLYITEIDWDARVIDAFLAEPRLGVAGFCGGRGVGHNGLRNDVWSNMTEAEVHGSRGWGRIWVSVLDGMALAMRRQMLEVVGGFDEGYVLHHRYDYDICMASIASGFMNMLIGVACHHQSGLTASSIEYIRQAAETTGYIEHYADQAVHDANHERYLRKWQHLFPLYF